MNKPDLPYDIEVAPNMFLFGVQDSVTGQPLIFEISEFKDERRLFFEYMQFVFGDKLRMIGFNSIGYDYPIIHQIMNILYASFNSLTPYDIYKLSKQIVDTPWNNRFINRIWESEWYTPQVDLMLVHHFDNESKRTSLKALEINMRMCNVMELPFDPDMPLSPDKVDDVKKYLRHDLSATYNFYKHSLPLLNFRDELSQRYNKNMLNFNDTKIGEHIFVHELEKKAPTICYYHVNGKRQTRQTIRDYIDLNDVVLPYVSFEHPEFNRIKNWFMSQRIYETKGVFKDVSCSVNGFQFDFGTGGIHGSVAGRKVVSDDDYQIIDVDVVSFYPSLAIVNKLYPEHLGEIFCDVYSDLKDQRTSYKKGTPENAALKLALNGTYGKSNSIYSPFYDPKFTMAITINGQLLLCMLAEQLMKTPGLQLLQMNTDGLTINVPRNMIDHVKSVCQWWESLTCLELEYNNYDRMFIRDVNSYIAEKEDGSIKRIGAYVWQCGAKHGKKQWHQDQSALIVPMAAEQTLLHGVDTYEFIKNHNEMFDFFMRIKVPRNSRLYIGNKKVQNTTRYCVTTEGGVLKKVMPPLKGKTNEREFIQRVGYLVTETNDITFFDTSIINYDYYYTETMKLIEPFF